VKIAGVVLAGGQSLRMGQDKSSLMIEQLSLLKRAVNLLQNSGLKDCFVSGDHQDYRCIKDKQAGLGPIGGIAACNSALTAEYDAMLVIPVDMPLLAIQDCSYLLQQYLDQVSASNKPTEVPGLFYQQAIFPLVISLTDPLSCYCENIINSSDKKSRSLFRLFESLDIKGIPLNTNDRFRFENTNTPEQWQRCLTTYSKMHKINSEQIK